MFKDREDLTPLERRWKWVKEECYPEDLEKLIGILKGGKKPKNADENDDENEKKTKEVVDPNTKEYFETVLKTRDDLEIDYTNLYNVKTRLEILTEEKFKGKYSAKFHV